MKILNPKSILSLLAFFLVFSPFVLAHTPLQCSISVDNIILEKVNGIDPQNFCLGDSIRVSADVSLTGYADPTIYLDLYVDNRFYETKSVNIPVGSSARVTFDKLIYTSDFGVTDPTVKIVARADCDSDGTQNSKFFTIQSCPACPISASISIPDKAFVGDTLHSIVYFYNSGQGEYVDVNAYLCKADDSSCESMNCNGLADPRIYVPRYSNQSLQCSKKLTNTGDYRIKVDYSSCEDPIIYSNVFTVNPRRACTSGYIGIQCLGNLRQGLYIDSECSTAWRVIEHCKYGCSGAYCKGPDGIPSISNLKPEYKGEACRIVPFSFSVENVGDVEENFKIQVSGDAAGWIKIAPSVVLEKDETKTVAAYVSIPCNVNDGIYDFSIKVSNEASDEASSYIRVERLTESQTFTGLFAFDLTIIFLAIALILVLLAVILLFRSEVYRYRNRRKPESF